YCALSANPVGRLVLQLFDRHDDAMRLRSDAICTALQLANFWQDVAIDLDKGRCYLPREDLRRFGCGDELATRRTTPAFAEMMRFEVERTRALLQRGAGLPRQVGGRLGFELRLVLAGAGRVLDLNERSGYDVLGSRPALTSHDWGGLIL